eukprot:TRINITY_DN6927_c0_g1_i2.p1 TRINITY_DN6927_c0_g1~~TRINITY_DN6927_c0_g1_i2.p1  ORF type:complete len:159 (+),score=49.28 TRINITY_DN6927_c0_g1_i2:119-595(+)
MLFDFNGSPRWVRSGYLWISTHDKFSWCYEASLLAQIQQPQQENYWVTFMLETVREKGDKKRKRGDKNKDSNSDGTITTTTMTESEEQDAAAAKKKAQQTANDKSGVKTRISSGKLIMPLRMINNWFNRKLKFIEVSLFVLELLKEKKASSQPFSMLD